MKNFILFFSVITLTLTSCSSDDSSPSEEQFIGTWIISKSFTNGVEDILDACEKKFKISVNADGSYTEDYFYNDNDICELDTDYGFWENIGGDIYRIVYDAGPGEQAQTRVVTIVFEGNTFYREEVDNKVTYKYVYERN